MSYQELPVNPLLYKDYSQPRCGGNGLPWNTQQWTKDNCSGEFVNTGNGDIIVRGVVNKSGVDRVLYWAPAPPTYSQSFSGSALPYANPTMAFDRTPNKGAAVVNNGRFEFRIRYPNAYYIGLGSYYVPPHVSIKPCRAGTEESSPENTTAVLQLDEGIPFRTLTYPAPPSKKPRISPMFYCEPSYGARSQETILRESGYPEVNKMPDNFWGRKPPR
jgi:hypothetical protein